MLGAHSVWQLLALAVIWTVIAFTYVLYRLGTASYWAFLSALGNALGISVAIVGIPRGQRGKVPARGARYLFAAFIAVVTLLALLYPVLQQGRYDGFGICMRDQLQGHRALVHAIVSWIFMVLQAAVAICCTLVDHPPSAYSRSAVWCTWTLWVEYVLWSLFDSSYLCAGDLSRPETSEQHLLECAGYSLGGITVVWYAMMVLQAVQALERSLGKVLVSGPILWLLALAGVCALGAGASRSWSWKMGPLSDEVLAIMGLGVAVTSFCCALMIFWAMRRPLRLLQSEAQRLKGSPAPRAEALWAARTIRHQRAAILVTAIATLTYYLSSAVRTLDSALSGETVDLIIGYLMGGMFDILMALTVGVVSGLISPSGGHLPKPPCQALRPARSKGLGPGLDPAAQGRWDSKVAELAGRGFPLSAMLDFYESLLRGEMPSFTPGSTTTDVVRQAVIPASRLPRGGAALAAIWSGGRPVLPQRMVTHAWSNRFVHLVAALVADGLGLDHYSGVAEELRDAAGVRRLRARLRLVGALGGTYWVCAFSVNQHACICGGFGAQPPAGDAREWVKWRRRASDSQSGEPYPVCACGQPKYAGSEAESEMNKFDDMMNYLQGNVAGFALVVAVDMAFDLFSRAWCVAELVEADTSGIPQGIKIHSEETLDRNYDRLSMLDVTNCRATIQADKDLILSKIPDLDAFNNRLQWLVFGTEGIFQKWSDAQARAETAGRIASRALGRATTNYIRLGQLTESGDGDHGSEEGDDSEESDAVCTGAWTPSPALEDTDEDTCSEEHPAPRRPWWSAH